MNPLQKTFVGKKDQKKSDSLKLKYRKRIIEEQETNKEIKEYIIAEETIQERIRRTHIP